MYKNKHIKGFIGEKSGNLSGFPKDFQQKPKDFQKKQRKLKDFQRIQKIFNDFRAMDAAVKQYAVEVRVLEQSKTSYLRSNQ